MRTRRAHPKPYTHIFIHNLFIWDHKLISFHRIALCVALKIAHETALLLWLVNTNDFGCARSHHVAVFLYCNHHRWRSEAPASRWRRGKFNRNIYTKGIYRRFKPLKRGKWREKPNYIFDGWYLASVESIALNLFSFLAWNSKLDPINWCNRAFVMRKMRE